LSSEQCRIEFNLHILKVFELGRDTCSRDELWTGLGLDWIRTTANFVEFGLDPDCRLNHFAIREADRNWTGLMENK